MTSNTSEMPREEHNGHANKKLMSVTSRVQEYQVGNEEVAKDHRTYGGPSQHTLGL